MIDPNPGPRRCICCAITPSCVANARIYTPWARVELEVQQATTVRPANSSLDAHADAATAAPASAAAASFGPLALEPHHQQQQQQQQQHMAVLDARSAAMLEELFEHAGRLERGLVARGEQGWRSCSCACARDQGFRGKRRCFRGKRLGLLRQRQQRHNAPPKHKQNRRAG